jgi:hypothetical protein
MAGRPGSPCPGPGCRVFCRQPGPGAFLLPVPFGEPPPVPPRQSSGPGESEPMGYRPGAPGFLNLSPEKKSLFAASAHLFSASLHRSRRGSRAGRGRASPPGTCRERPGSSIFPLKKNLYLRHLPIYFLRASTGPAAAVERAGGERAPRVPAGSAAAHKILFL